MKGYHFISEREYNSFSNFLREELDELGIKFKKAIETKKEEKYLKVIEEFIRFCLKYLDKIDYKIIQDVGKIHIAEELNFSEKTRDMLDELNDVTKTTEIKEFLEKKLKELQHIDGRSKMLKIDELKKRKKEIEKEIRAIWEEKILEIVEKLKNGDLKEEQALEETTDYVKNTTEIEDFLELFVQISNRNGLNLKSIKRNLAIRLYENSKNSFLDVPQNELSRAMELFKQIGDKKMVEACKKLFNKMFKISKENTLD